MAGTPPFVCVGVGVRRKSNIPRSFHPLLVLAFRVADGCMKRKCVDVRVIPPPPLQSRSRDCPRSRWRGHYLFFFLASALLPPASSRHWRVCRLACSLSPAPLLPPPHRTLPPYNTPHLSLALSRVSFGVGVSFSVWVSHGLVSDGMYLSYSFERQGFRCAGSVDVDAVAATGDRWGGFAAASCIRAPRPAPVSPQPPPPSP
ncbi:hypothetical protein B0H11DRAFT_2229005 [Mycena galericulata]|nr:hypothetical protein B0H11DRAFT_2229005 [Mycena galericulata]